MMQKKLPWWTWVLPFFILLGATYLSLPFKLSQSFYWIYFPTNLGLIMALWWGPRVFLGALVNTLISLRLFEIPAPSLHPFFAISEFLEIALAYYLVRERFKGFIIWKTTPKNIGLFFLYGLIIPAIPSALATQGAFTAAGILDKSVFIENSLITIIGDISGATFLALPLLLIASPRLSRRGLSLFRVQNLPRIRWSTFSRKEKFNLLAGTVGIISLAFSVYMREAWYLYGIIMLAASAWYGIQAALIANTLVFFATLILPRILTSNWTVNFIEINTPATILALGFCSLITGSAVTSLKVKLRELSETERQLKKTKDQAEEASRAKSEFLARMSHEIRTPLNSVLGMLELLRETELSKDQERYLTLFSHAGENLKALINDLLDFSKIEAKALTVENVGYNIHSTIRSVFEILQIKAEEKGLQFELNISSDLPPLQWGDPTRLRQVLFNLIGNALKFTTEGAVIVKADLYTEGNGEMIQVEVQDTGIGIPREKQSILFQPFSQVDASISRKYGGTGLGLVISKNLVEIMGGTLSMRSRAGRGTSFLIHLPHRPDYSSNIERKPGPPPLWRQLSLHKNFRLLLVDDSEDNRVLMVHYLRSLPFDCEEAVNGQEAVDKFKENRYDLIFMDMQMPIMSGYKATELIRHDEKIRGLEHTPIIALTATAVIEDLNRALTSGCDAYAVKPVKKTEILEILAAHLKTKESKKNPEKPSPSASL